jgi:succinylglutamate desuccinylase
MNRKIGEYIGKERGPLVLCIGGIHGNETAGINALKNVLSMLENEPTRNPSFNYKGKFVAIHGNLQAIDVNQRYIDKDLNRNFVKSRLHLLNRPKYAEDFEAFQIIDLIKKEIEEYQPESFVLIDIHTTSSNGGIFTIIPEDFDCLEIALSMHAPIIQGMTKGVTGTVMDYFTTELLGVKTKTLTFEAGQHEDPNAVILAIAAVIAALREIGSVEPSDVESRHDQVLINYSVNLPSITKLVMKHTIDQSKSFKMVPGYLNFQEVKKGEIVAHNIDGPIAIKEDGLILMPLYQEQGEDGFFLIKRVEKYEFH